MERTKSTLCFNYLEKRYGADVHALRPAGKTMVRVHVPLEAEKGRKYQVFVFYKLKPDELFWYDRNDEFRQGMAKKIADTLLAH